MDVTESQYNFWKKIDLALEQFVPNHIKNSFNLCGYSNRHSLICVGDNDIKHVERFVSTELLELLDRKCKQKRTIFDVKLKRNFFGNYASNPNAFIFDIEDRNIIKSILKLLIKNDTVESDNLQIPNLRSVCKSTWYFNDEKSSSGTSIESELIAPFASMNLMCKLMNIGKANAHRPKNGYRYSHDVKRFAVYNRILSGRLAYRTLQANTFGLIPTITSIDKYIHKPENVVIEGELRSNELVAYLQERKVPLWVVLSEDATVIDNIVQYDSHTNQAIGFVLPINKQTGMPIPFSYKTENVEDFVNYFTNAPVANYINTVIARPIGDAPPFCLLLFGSDNRYDADSVSKRWEYITSELEKLGVGVLVFSSDSDPKFNSAMRKNSNLGHESNLFSSTNLFKCGIKLSPVFYAQDTPHNGTKMRNLMLKTITNPKKLPFGKKYIDINHLQALVNRFDKTKHSLTKTTLNPTDRQNYDSVLRICSPTVIKMLKAHIKDSEATVIYLEMMLNTIEAFMSENLPALERIGKMYYVVFITRIWKCFVLKSPNLTLKNNFMSTYLHYCLEQNAHSLVLIVLFLRNNSLSHLFVPWLFNSQACEKFYAQIRSLCSTYSMVATCTVKEAINRISKIHILNEISNDTESGFVYPKSNHAINSSNLTNVNHDLPTEKDIYEEILNSKSAAIKSAIQIGLIKNGKNFENCCDCKIAPYVPSNLMKNRLNITKNKIYNLERLRANGILNLKNFANKFVNEKVDKTGPYLEIPFGDKRFVTKKSSICWLFRKESPKLSSDRLIRVRGGCRKKSLKIKKIKHFSLKPKISKRKQ